MPLHLLLEDIAPDIEHRNGDDRKAEAVDDVFGDYPLYGNDDIQIIE